MAWQGVFKKLSPGDMWIKGEHTNIIGILSHPMAGIFHEMAVAAEFVEDDGRPFEEGEKIELLIRRVA